MSAIAPIEVIGKESKQVTSLHLNFSNYTNDKPFTHPQTGEVFPAGAVVVQGLDTDTFRLGEPFSLRITLARTADLLAGKTFPPGYVAYAPADFDRLLDGLELVAPAAT